MKKDSPGILGGKPIFKSIVPIIKPPLYRYAKPAQIRKIKDILAGGMVTNATYVRELEAKAAKYLKVKRAVALSSCSSGLMLVLQALGLQGKEVIIPSFTFSATGHVCHWNGCNIVFADCDPETFNISVKDVKRKITKKTAAVIGVHIFGNPAPAKELATITKKYKAKLIFDAAHGFGVSLGGKKIGNFGDAEVFSCSPTKLFITMEGGIVATNDTKLADTISRTRNYGNNPDYSCEIPGLSARMTEMNAFVGLQMIPEMDMMIRNRNKYAALYRKHLKGIPGLRFQKIAPGGVHGYKDFGMIVDPRAFGVDRDVLYQALTKENVMAKKYFYPPLHKLAVYKKVKGKPLPHTEYVSNNILCVPVYSFMKESTIKGVAAAIARVQAHAGDIKKKIKDT